MTKSTKSNQRSKSTASDAKIKPVSQRVKNHMAQQIAKLNSPPYSFTYEEISLAMGHESGYAHLVQHGGRVAPTRIEAQALEGMLVAANKFSSMFRSDIDKRVTMIGLCAQLQRMVNEL